MRTLLGSACLIAFALHATNVLAGEDDSFANYDSIVNELKASAEEPAPQSIAMDDWDEVALHAGVAVNTSLIGVHLPDGSSASGLFKGLQFSIGMNLFSRLLRAEGAFTTYQHEDFGQGINGDLHEFEMRLVYLPSVGERMLLRAGLGVAARYLDMNTHTSKDSFSQSTPTTVVMLGLERKLNANISFGPDLSYRSALVQDTFDKSSWDASFRLNATF